MHQFQNLIQFLLFVFTSSQYRAGITDPNCYGVSDIEEFRWVILNHNAIQSDNITHAEVATNWSSLSFSILKNMESYDISLGVMWNTFSVEHLYYEVYVLEPDFDVSGKHFNTNKFASESNFNSDNENIIKGASKRHITIHVGVERKYFPFDVLENPSKYYNSDSALDLFFSIKRLKKLSTCDASNQDELPRLVNYRGTHCFTKFVGNDRTYHEYTRFPPWKYPLKSKEELKAAIAQCENAKKNPDRSEDVVNQEENEKLRKILQLANEKLDLLRQECP